MKKAFLLGVLTITPALVFAQGMVALNNQTGLVKQCTSISDSTLISVSNSGGYVQLIAAPKGTPLPHPLGAYSAGCFFAPSYSSLAAFLADNPGWAAATNNSGAAPGLIAAGPGLFNAGTYTIGNIAEAANADYLLIGWTGNYPSYDAAYAAVMNNLSASFLGMSAIATTSTGDPLGFPPGTAVNLKLTFAGMILGSYVLPDPPWFPVSPVSQQVTVGGTATLSAIVEATPAPACQWALNGSPITGATASSYTITNAQYTNAGTYSIRATNVLGSASAWALLQVLPAGGPSLQLNGQLAVGTVTSPASAQLTVSGGFTNGSLFYTLDGSVPTTNSLPYTGPTTLTNSVTIQALSLSADASQTAVSPAVLLQIIPVYPLQTSVAEGGSISTYPGSGPYASNSVVVLYPHAQNNWAFDHWTGDLTGNQNPANLTMNGPRSVQAVFMHTAYPLTLSTPGGGSLTANGQALLQPTFFSTGSVVTLTAVASNGWSFVGWQGGASGTNNPLALSMNQTNLVQGVFGTAVGTNILGAGSIALSPPNPVPYGTPLAAAAVPAPGNYFVVWSGAASGTNSLAAILVTNPTPTVRALFSTVPADKYPLNVVMIGAYAGLTVTGAVGNAYQIQYSPDLAMTNHWTTLTNLTLQQPIQIWVDSSVDALTRSHGYYRVWSGP